MNLFLFRHASAALADPAEVEQLGAETADARRPLTEKGRKRFVRGVRALEHAGVRFDRLVHSPWRRAVETADLLHPLLRGTTEVCGELASAPTDALLGVLAGERVGVVGHQPWLGQLVGQLTGAPPELFDWKKGGMVWLVGEPAPGGMRVRAVVSRRLLGG